MEIVTTTDRAAVDEAARIWANAIAKRDETEADVEDYSGALDLIHECLDNSERSFVLVLSAEPDGILAFGAIEPSRDDDDPAVGELRYLGVAPGHWGEGWARRLLVALPNAMRQHDYREAVLWVYADNIRAIWVYEAMGWTATKQSRRHAVTGRIEEKYRRTLR